MKERCDVHVLGVTPTKLTFIIMYFICLTLLMMWASEDDDVALLSSFTHTHLRSISPTDISTDLPVVVTSSISDPQAPRSISNTTSVNSFGVSHKGCNYGIGKWVVDERRPLYSGANCKRWLSKAWACRFSQRRAFAYEKFRWQPKDCELPEFHASNFLHRMRDKTLAFIGDSLGQQQFQSLMCMIVGNEARPNVIDVGKEYNLIKTHKKSRPNGWGYRFPTSNTTILFYWSPCLCDLVRFKRSKVAMHLDRPPAFLQTILPKLDLVVLNTGHHWTLTKAHSNHWVIHAGGVPYPTMNIGKARNFTINNITQWMDKWILKQPSLKVFFQTISPSHFSDGEWYKGGTCDNNVPFLSKKNEVHEFESKDKVVAKAVQGTRVKMLDITALSELRDEGHVSKYGGRARHGIQDCLHWCLPGIPDVWNEILLAQL